MGVWLMMAAACALFVAPDTTESIIEKESGGNVFAVHVNGLDKRQQPTPVTAAAAVDAARYFITHGYSVDLGLMQVNSRNLGTFHASLADAFVPCRNIEMGATILAADYAEAARKTGPGLTALLAALSAYNTGNFYDGFLNGYVSQYSYIPAGLMSYAQAEHARVAQYHPAHVAVKVMPAPERVTQMKKVERHTENRLMFFD